MLCGWLNLLNAVNGLWFFYLMSKRVKAALVIRSYTKTSGILQHTYTLSCAPYHSVQLANAMLQTHTGTTLCALLLSSLLQSQEELRGVLLCMGNQVLIALHLSKPADAAIFGKAKVVIYEVPIRLTLHQHELKIRDISAKFSHATDTPFATMKWYSMDSLRHGIFLMH